MPRFVVVLSGVALASLLLSLAIVLQVQRWSDSEAQRDCERAVGVRDDGRAMWLYLVDQGGNSDQARVDAFVAELNDRLPPLKCVDGNAVPR